MLEDGNFSCEFFCQKSMHLNNENGCDRISEAGFVFSHRPQRIQLKVESKESRKLIGYHAEAAEVWGVG